MGEAAEDVGDRRGDGRLAGRRDERPRDPKGRLARSRRRQPGGRRRHVRRGRARVVARLLEQPRGILTFLTGEAPSRSTACSPSSRARIPSSSSSPRGRSAALRAALAAQVTLRLRPSGARRSRSCSSRTTVLPRDARASPRSSRGDRGCRVGRGRSRGRGGLRELRPDVVVIDYACRVSTALRPARTHAHLPGHPRDPGLTASVTQEERRLVLATGAVACITKDENLDRIVESILMIGAEVALVRLTASNTAIVLDSTADFPEGSRAVLELAGRAAVRQLRRDELPRLRRSGARRVLRTAAATLPSRRPPPSPTPGDFLAVYEELAGAYERIYSLQLSSTLSGTFASAETAAATVGDAVRVVDTRTVSAAVAMLALPLQRRLERGTTDEEIEALVERYRASHGLLFTVDTLEYLARGGRIGRGAAFAGTLLNVKPILGLEHGEVVPLKRVRGSQKALEELQVDRQRRDGRRAVAADRARPRRCSGSRCGARADRPRGAAAGDDRGRDGARRRRRHPRGAGHTRSVLVRRRPDYLTVSCAFLEGRADRARSYTRDRW